MLRGQAVTRGPLVLVFLFCFFRGGVGVVWPSLQIWKEEEESAETKRSACPVLAQCLKAWTPPRRPTNSLLVIINKNGGLGCLVGNLPMYTKMDCSLKPLPSPAGAPSCFWHLFSSIKTKEILQHNDDSSN